MDGLRFIGKKADMPSTGAGSRLTLAEQLKNGNISFNFTSDSVSSSDSFVRTSSGQDISSDIDLNGDGIITEDELTSYISSMEGTDDSKETKTEKGRDENGVATYDSVMDITKEEVQDMSGEEIAELIHDALLQGLTLDFQNGTSSNMNHIRQNALLFNLVNKMSDKQLDDFMAAYQEKYPKSVDGNSLDFFSFESLESGVMWGQYAVEAGLISKDDANSALERLKSYFPKLNPEPNMGHGVKQWL